MAHANTGTITSSFLSRFSAPTQPPSTPMSNTPIAPGESELAQAGQISRLGSPALASNPAVPGMENTGGMNLWLNEDEPSPFAPRRPRDPVAEDMFERVRQAPYPGQQLRAFAVARCAAAGLSADQTTSILEFAELDPMQMMVAYMVEIQKTENQLFSRILRLYIRHPDFTIRLRHNLAAALFAPKLGAYVVGLLSQIMTHFEKNLHSLSLPSTARNDPAEWRDITTAASVELAQMRQGLKQKIEMSVKSKADIYELTKDALIYDIKATPEHFARFAFLRALNVAHKELESKPKPTFWEYVDKELELTRKEQKGKPPMFSAQLFAHVLAADRTTYPPASGAFTRRAYSGGELSEVQRNMEATVGTFLNDDRRAAPDGDIGAEIEVEQ